MDDTQDKGLAVRAILIVGVFLALAFPAQQMYGDTGVTIVLLLALAAVVMLLQVQRTSGLRLATNGSTGEAAPVEDTWRSERWVREAVERGIRAIDDWRHDQTA